MQALDSFEFSARRTRRSMYDYDTLLNGKIWKLVEGVDYDCKVISMTMQLKKEAKNRGVDLRLAKTDDGLVIQAVLPPSAAAPEVPSVEVDEPSQEEAKPKRRSAGK